MSIRCVIVDDEPLARQVISEYLEAHPDIELIGEFGNPQHAFESITHNKPDLLFLDIQMPQINGFELLKMLPEKPVVVFCTAFDQYAIRAFEANAVDYLLKPFDQARFDQALAKAKHYLETHQHSQQLDNLLHYLQNQQHTTLDRFVVRKGDHLCIVNSEDIYWLEALEDYVRIHTHKEQYLVLQRLGELEKRLAENRFVRVHRSLIVNLDKIKKIHHWSSGRYLLELKDGTELETSKSGARVIREMML